MAINELGMEIKEYKLLDEKEYDAVIFGVVNVGLHAIEYEGEQKAPGTFVRLVLEIPSEVDEEGNVSTVQKKIRLTNNIEKGNYAKLLVALGEKVNKNNINSYLSNDALKSLLGKVVTVKLEHFETKDGARNTVRELGKLDSRLPQPKGTREHFFFTPYGASPDIDVFKKDVTPFTQKEIMSSLNSDHFDKSLHEVYASLQEDYEKEKAGATAKGAKKTNTSAIE